MADIKKILSQMTTEEKIGQLMQLNGVTFTATDADITGPDAELKIGDEYIDNVGSALTFSDVKDTIEVQKKHLEKDRNKIPMIFMMDVIHGFRTIFPIPLALGCSFDPKLVEECSHLAAKEASAGGIHVTFTPMVDYVRDARWGRVMETCGEDVLLNGIMGAAQVRGFQGSDLKDKDSIATCVKHFAAYGGAEGGRDYNTVELSERALREYYLPAYKACLDEGATMVMPSFNTVNGVPSIANEWLIKKILKEEWGFDGVIISDYAAVDELITHGVAENKKEAAKMAFANYCDMEMCSDTYCNHLKELIKEGVFSEKQLDEAVLRVLTLKDKLGLFENPYHGTVENAEETFLTKESRDIVRRAAEESAVLLKNNGILPLSENTGKIALIGPFADNNNILGWWACNGKNEECVTVKEGIAGLTNAQITVARGCSNKFGDEDRSGFEDAIAKAKEADVVILCLGEPQEYSGESNSRAHLELPGLQEELCREISKVNKNTVALIFSGRPNVLTNIDKNVSAMLHMWFPGNEGGNAAANLLFGKSNPCGKITMSFPKATGQCPIYYNRTNTGRPKVAPDDNFELYRSNYIDCGILPLYSFGHGLSYCDFEYESLELSKDNLTEKDEITVKVTVTNKSSIAGKETVMLFMKDVCASNARPVQQLVSFSKESFLPGEKKTVEFKINEKMLRFLNNNNQLVSEKGEFEISCGYADHLLHTKSFYLA